MGQLYIDNTRGTKGDPYRETAREIIDKLLETYSYNYLHGIIDELYEQHESEDKWEYLY